VLLERSWLAGFNGIYLGKIWIQNVGDIDFKLISVAENSNKFPGFGRKNHLRTWEHLGQRHRPITFNNT
jgi:hypothetical protein